MTTTTLPKLPRETFPETQRGTLEYLTASLAHQLDFAYIGPDHPPTVAMVGQCALALDMPPMSRRYRLILVEIVARESDGLIVRSGESQFLGPDAYSFRDMRSRLIDMLTLMDAPTYRRSWRVARFDTRVDDR